MAKNFKPGQKVVYKKVSKKGVHSHILNYPKDNEVVTIHSRAIELPGDLCAHWYIKEYPTSKNGLKQALGETNLFPLEDISKEETEKLTTKLEEQFQQFETSKLQTT